MKTTTDSPDSAKLILSRRIARLSMPLLAALASLLICGGANATSSVVVDGMSGPWQYVNGGLNNSFQFGVNDHLAPTIIGGLFAGEQVVLTYQSGTVNTASTGWPPNNSYVDARGVLSLPNPNLAPHLNGDTPSVYMGESLSSPKYLGQLVGTFADGTGQIVGNPFAVGNGPITFLVPVGAARLQLGVNDNLFGDNLGSWTIELAVVPEPSVIALVVAGIAGLFLGRRNEE